MALEATQLNTIKLILFSLVSDIDECLADPGPCDENADCTNSDGSYSCTCKPGFTGDGTVCQGMLDLQSTDIVINV